MMKTTIILAVVAVIAAVGAVASAQFTTMATPAYACQSPDKDDLHGQSSIHDANGDLHSHNQCA